MSQPFDVKTEKQDAKTNGRSISTKIENLVISTPPYNRELTRSIIKKEKNVLMALKNN